MTEVKRQSMNALKKVGLKTFRTEPQEDGDAGFYEFFDASNSKWTAVEIFSNIHVCRATGDETIEWLALVNKQVIPSYEVWVDCCARPVSREQYEAMLKEAESSETVTRVNFTRS